MKGNKKINELYINKLDDSELDSICGGNVHWGTIKYAFVRVFIPTTLRGEHDRHLDHLNNCRAVGLAGCLNDEQVACLLDMELILVHILALAGLVGAGYALASYDKIACWFKKKFGCNNLTKK